MRELGITLARRITQAIRMEGEHESSHWFSDSGLGGGGNSYGARSVFAAYATGDEKGDQAGGTEFAVAVQRRDSGRKHAVSGGAAGIGAKDGKTARKD